MQVHGNITSKLLWKLFQRLEQKLSIKMGETATAVIGVNDVNVLIDHSQLPRVCRCHGLTTTWSENSPAFCA